MFGGHAVLGERFGPIETARAMAVTVTVRDGETRVTRAERFGREHHLRLSRDFARVRREGRLARGAALSLGYARQVFAAAAVANGQPATPDGTEARSPGAQPAGPTRVGFSVGKRVGGAVARNRVKRRLREIARRQMLPRVAPGWDLVIIAWPPAAMADSAALAAELERLVARAKVLALGSEESLA